jgi:acetyl esterase/lipase
MGLDAFYVERFAEVRDVTWDDVYSGDTDAIERAIAFGRPAAEYEVPAAVHVKEHEVTGPHGLVSVRVYRSRIVESDAPVFMWMHGGAFKWGDLDMLEAHAVAAELAQRAGVVVVSVAYRLAPEYAYPVPLDDCLAVARWIADEREAIGGDGRRLAVGGASAGANLAVATALRARDEHGPHVRAVLLAYPGLHLQLPAPSAEVAERVQQLPPLARFDDPRAREDHYRDYLGDAYDDPPPYGVPAIADLCGLPPVAIANADYDDLRPSGEAFGEQLRRSAVDVDAWTEAGTAHGYLNAVGAVAGASRTLDRFAAVLQQHLRPDE